MWALAYCSSCPGTFAWSPVPVNIGKNYMLPSFSSTYRLLTLTFTLLSFPKVFTFSLLWMWLWCGGGGLALIRSLKHVMLSCLFMFFFPFLWAKFSSLFTYWACTFWTFIPNRNVWFPLINGFFSSFLNMTLMLWAIFGNIKNIVDINFFNSTSHPHHVYIRWYSACEININVDQTKIYFNGNKLILPDYKSI